MPFLSGEIQMEKWECGGNSLPYDATRGAASAWRRQASQ